MHKRDTLVNIGELERRIDTIYVDLLNLRREIEKETPNMANVKRYLTSAEIETLKAKDFNFVIEVRTIRD